MTTLQAIVSTNDLRHRLNSSLDKLEEAGMAQVIRNSRPVAVMMSLEHYEDMLAMQDAEDAMDGKGKDINDLRDELGL